MFTNTSDGEVGWRLWVGSGLDFYFPDGVGHTRTGRKSKLHGRFFTRDSKKGHAYPAMARVMGNTAHAMPLRAREGPWLSQGVFGVRDC